jgi:hypothetical protein
MADEQIVREAEQHLQSLTRSDLIYRDTEVIGRSLDYDEWVAVATYGAAHELTGANDTPEPWPIRVRVHDADGSEAEAYLSIEEAQELRHSLTKAIRRARRYPQPEEDRDV